MNVQEIKQKATELKNQLGGTIFAFPIEEENPLSNYAVVTMVGNSVSVFPHECTVEEAAVGIKEILKGFKKDSLDTNFDKNVRFISFQPQIDAPSVTMRRMKKLHQAKKPVYQTREDVVQKGEDFAFTARGVIKMSYLSMVDDKLPKAKQFMMEYYKLLSMRKYGRSATLIHSEVSRMNKDKAIDWIEKTYEKYIHDDMEIFNIMNLIKK
jgi:hypothetical protein